MRKYFLLMLLVIPIGVFCQQFSSITGLLGIEFGSSKEKVIQVMKSRGYSPDPKSKNLTFDNVKFGAFDKCYVMFSFIENKFYQAGIILPDFLEAKILEQYYKLNTEISIKYGEGNSYSDFTYPYEKGDGYEVTAIKLGKANYRTYWTDEIGAIESSISSNMFVIVTYQDNKLIEEAIKKRNLDNSNDY